jgi:hypothetical protein
MFTCLTARRALRTTQELGDVREVALTQANLSHLLFQQGEHHHALFIVWEAYSSLQQSGFISDAQAIQHLLISIKVQMLDPALFDALCAQVIHQPQSAWLRDV